VIAVFIAGFVLLYIVPMRRAIEAARNAVPAKVYCLECPRDWHRPERRAGRAVTGRKMGESSMYANRWTH
jgi:hypothetical protein